MPPLSPPRASQPNDDGDGDGSVEERRIRRSPIDIQVDLDGSTSALLDWIVAATDTFASKKSVWSKAAAGKLKEVISQLRGRWLENLEVQSKKDAELLHIYLELANERKKMVELRSEIDESRRAVASAGSKKRRASVDSEIFRSIQESDCVSVHSINSSSSRNDVPEDALPSLPAISAATGRTRNGTPTTATRTIAQNIGSVPQETADSDTDSSEWRIAGPRRKNRQRRQRPPNHRAPPPRQPARGHGQTGPPDPSENESTILCVTLRGKIEPNGRWDSLSADELETVRSAVSGLLNGVRVSRTFAVGGGLGLLLPDRRQWNAAVGSIGRDPNLITKEILRNTSTIKILFPRGASELGSYSGQFLLNDLGKKNGMDTSRTTVIKQTQSFAIIRGPSSILSRFATDGRIFLGLASCKVAKMSSKGSLCYHCGRYHPIGGNKPCSAPARCVRCGGQHSLELCPQPKYFRGLRSCSNCDGPHSAIEHCCKPIYVRNGNPPRREATGREVPTTADDRSDGAAVDMAVDALSPVALEDGRDD